MDLSHQSITGRQFELNRRGYDPDAVDAHLAEIAAAVQEKERQLAELQTTITGLEAKVRDADESEEALRLTLKAAAHAKEELLAGAREQAQVTQAEADETAAKLIADAEERARSLTDEAQSRSASLTSEAETTAAALKSGATAQAREVAQAALAESELLVERIEQLRSEVGAAEESLRALSAESNPRLHSASAVLDAALERARASAENPELLAAAATPAAPIAAVPEFPGQEPAEPEPVEVLDESPAEHPVAAAPEGDVVVDDSPDFAASAEDVDPSPAAGSDSQPSYSDEHSHPEEFVAQAEQEDPPAPEFVAEPAAPTDIDATEESQPQGEIAADQGNEGSPHLEVVDATPAEPAESTADISDKVDRLLEELREVT